MFASSLALTLALVASPVSAETEGAVLAEQLLLESEQPGFNLDRAQSRFAFLTSSEQQAFIDAWKSTAEPTDYNLRLYLMFKDAQDGHRARLPRLAQHRRSVAPAVDRGYQPDWCQPGWNRPSWYRGEPRTSWPEFLVGVAISARCIHQLQKQSR